MLAFMVKGCLGSALDTPLEDTPNNLVSEIDLALRVKELPHLGLILLLIRPSRLQPSNSLKGKQAN